MILNNKFQNKLIRNVVEPARKALSNSMHYGTFQPPYKKSPWFLVLESVKNNTHNSIRSWYGASIRKLITYDFRK